jgi:AAA domain
MLSRRGCFFTLCHVIRDLAMELGLVPRVFTAESLMKKKIEPLRWVVDGFVPEGLTLLAAKPKVGKSWLCIGVSRRIAIPFCNYTGSEALVCLCSTTASDRAAGIRVL